MVNKQTRLMKITKLLQNSSGTVSGSEWARLPGVSRQMIVKDIEELREQGYRIQSGQKGYSLSSQKKCRMTLSVKHGDSDIVDELSTILSEGGAVIDVVIIHPVYGEIRGVLNLHDFDDLNRFIASLRSSEAVPLLALSKDGVHLHTIEADSEDGLEKIRAALEKKGYLAVGGVGL